MTSQRFSQPDRDSTGRLLGSSGRHPPSAPSALGRLLAAATAPVEAAVLVGEADAMDAFRAAQLGLLVRPTRRRLRIPAVARIFTACCPLPPTVGSDSPRKR